MFKSHKNKLKLKKLCDYYVKADYIKLIILGGPIIILYTQDVLAGNYHLRELLDVSILLSFTLVAVCEVLAQCISKWVQRKTEDACKLSSNCEELIKKYSRTRLFEFENTDGRSTILPAELIDLRSSVPYRINIDHTNANKQYELPSQIKANSSVLMKAHGVSNVYNNQKC